MRTFLAFELPDKFKSELSEVIDKFNIIDNSVKWVEKTNLHITLQFIGETKKKHISQIDQLIKSNLNEINPFTLFSPKIELNNPRIIWVKFDTKNAEINTFHKNIQHDLKSLNYDIDSRPLKIHVTLGRIKRNIQNDLIREMKNTKLNTSEIEVKNITFYESILHRTGPEYKTIYNYNIER